MAVWCISSCLGILYSQTLHDIARETSTIVGYRTKLLLPTIASMPLLIVFFVNNGSTVVAVPSVLRSVIGAASVQFGLKSCYA